MVAFINGLSCISHHHTLTDDFFFEETDLLPDSNFLFATEPAYKDYVPSAYLRRASHILKMGISAGRMCLKEADSEQVDAILVGTGMGCFEDTDKFLRAISDNAEEMLAPTAFIQSTHNTVAGQLALLTGCQGYNFTYVQQNLSFEYALLDALLLLKEGEAEDILLGGLDELTPSLCELFERAGHIKQRATCKIPLWESTSTGYVAGEGAAFFRLGNKQTAASSAKILGLAILPAIQKSSELLDRTLLFLSGLGLKKEELSLVLSGANGDVVLDSNLKGFNEGIGAPVAYFKQLCGEYFTASSFALWLAASSLKKQKFPSGVVQGGLGTQPLKHILIVNHFRDHRYALICVSSC